MMTSEERTHIIRLLEDSKEKYLSCIEDVNQAQWEWKPAPECWSVGETAEHIVQSEAILFRALHSAIQSPTNPDWETKTAGKTDLLERVMPDRGTKANAPRSTEPQGLPKEDAIGRFSELRAQIVKFAGETQVSLKEHTAEHPFPIFNTLNAYQWLLLIPLHTLRHHQQIAEVKATPGYPR
jgi:hypothetical protein